MSRKQRVKDCLPEYGLSPIPGQIGNVMLTSRATLESAFMICDESSCSELCSACAFLMLPCDWPVAATAAVAAAAADVDVEELLTPPLFPLLS